jgi:hypothetical protein
MKNIVKNQRTGFLYMGIVLAGVISLVFMPGCGNEMKIDLPIEAEVVNSIELEEFIIADIELQQSFNTFREEVKSIDFSKLEKTKDIEGITVLHIPTSICIENKTSEFNEKKELLLAKYPQLNSFSSDVKQKCFEQSIANSPKISKRILESGIGIHQPRLKGGSVEFFTGGSYCEYLATRVKSGDYVEVILLVFKDGTVMTYIDEKATPYSSSMTLYNASSTGEWYSSYYTKSPIEVFIHTHTSGGSPSQSDLNNKKPGLNSAIYYSGSIYYWNEY